MEAGMLPFIKRTGRLSIASSLTSHMFFGNSLRWQRRSSREGLRIGLKFRDFLDDLFC